MAKKKAKKKKTLPAKIEKVDEKRVNTAVQEITAIYHNKTHETVYALGECLCRYFYDNDIERIRSNKPVYGKSLNKLKRECELLPNGPSQAWLYVSVNLLVDRKDLDGHDEYEKLSVSHKQTLLGVKGVEAKKELIGQFITEQLSVRYAQKYTQKYLEENPNTRVTKIKKKSLQDILKNAHLFNEKEYRYLKQPSRLKKIPDNEVEKMIEDIYEQRQLNKKKMAILNQSDTELNKLFDFFKQRQDDIDYIEYLREKQGDKAVEIYLETQKNKKS